MFRHTPRSKSSPEASAWRQLHAAGFAGALAMALPLVAGAQSAPAATEPAPTLAETVAFVNSHLTEHASPWRPCRATAQLALADGGDITIEVTRSSYCEDSKLVASVHALDPNQITYEVADEILVRIPCAEGRSCARQLQKRKKRDGEDWAIRDSEWIPKPPAGQEHIISALELPMSSRTERAADVASALAYLLKAAKQEPQYAEPKDRFNREPPAASTPGSG